MFISVCFCTFSYISQVWFMFLKQSWCQNECVNLHHNYDWRSDQTARLWSTGLVKLQPIIKLCTIRQNRENRFHILYILSGRVHPICVGAGSPYYALVTVGRTRLTRNRTNLPQGSCLCSDLALTLKTAFDELSCGCYFGRISYLPDKTYWPE